MMSYIRVCLLVAVCWIATIEAAKLRFWCTGKWNQQYRCLRDGNNKAAEKDSKFQIPNQWERNRIRNVVINCFTKSNPCTTSPFSSEQESKARTECFNDIKKDLKNQLQQCVRQDITDFQMPDDEYDGNDFSYNEERTYNALKFPLSYCGFNAKSADLQACVNRDARYDFGKRPPNGLPSYYCAQDAQCWYNSGEDCRNTWEYQVLPSMCKCAGDKIWNRGIKIAQDAYTTCMTRKSQKAPKDDPAYKWIDQYLRSRCQYNNQHPCKRERAAKAH